MPATLAAVNIASKNISLPVEVIVIDNLSTDRTADLAHDYGARVISCEIRNISAVRNCGIQTAKHDLIVSIDADCITPPEAFQKILNFMAEGEYVGGGLGLQVLSSKITARIAVPIVQFIVERIGGIQGAVFFFLREEALAIGGFDESKLVAEDSAFSNALRKHAQAKGKKFGLLKL